MLATQLSSVLAPANATPLVVIDEARARLSSLLELAASLREQDLCYLICLRPGDGNSARIAEDWLLAQLDRASTLPVHRLRSGSRFVRGNVFVLSSQHSLQLCGEALRVVESDRQTLNADAVFSQLARTRMTRGAAVLLSNATPSCDYRERGLAEVRRAGGAVIAPTTSADVPGSPCYDATWPGYFGHCDDPRQIGEALSIWKRELIEPESLDAQMLNRLAVRLARRCGISLAGRNEIVVRQNVISRMARRRSATLADYVELTEASPRELAELCDVLLARVEARIPDPDLLQSFLGAGGWPENAAALRAWSVGCGQGEAAYSLAITLREHQRAVGDTRPLRVFATDAHPGRIARARDGLFPAYALARLRSDLVERYFERSGAGYRVRPRLRDCVLFQHHDVVQDPPYMKIDVLTCGYGPSEFEPEAWARVLSKLRLATRNTGRLLLRGTRE